MRLLLVILFVFLFGTTSYANDEKKEFISMVEGCIEGIDHPVHIPSKLIIGIAALESGWGTSRFTKEGNNLFGIRTFDLKKPNMQPLDNSKADFGVKVYDNKCDSVKDFIRIVENNYNYSEFRKLRDEGFNLYVLINSLTAYSENPQYTTILKKVVKNL